ncbi:MAG: hypothetical protein ACI837_000488 [Crocinitomicaceae bacterium]|jgi:hypothetical protein
MIKRLPKYVDYLILLIVLILAMWPLVMGNAVMKWDAMDLYLPWKYFITDTLSHNQLPLWNPYINGGFSQMGDPGSWYPVSWCIGWLSGSYSMGSLHFEYLLHLYIGGVGFYLLAKSHGWARAVCLVAAIAYMLSGLMIGNAQHVGWVVSAAWLPWILVFFKGMLHTPNFKTGIKLALVLFFMLSGGYPGMFIVTIYILLIYFIINTWQRYRAKEGIILKKQIVYLTVGTVVFIALSLVVLVASFDLAGLITRGVGLNDRTDVWNTLNGSLTPQSIVSYVYPLATAKNDQAFWGADFSMTNCYFGVFLLLSILLVVFQKNAPKNVRIYAIIGLVFLGIALGQDLPLRKWTTFLPFMDLFRFPSLFRLFALFFFVLSAGASLNYILQSDRLKKQFVYTLLAALVILGGISLVLFFGVERWKFPQIFSIGWLHFMKGATIKELIFLQGCILVLILGVFLLLVRTKKISWGILIVLIVAIEAISFSRMQAHATIIYDRSLADASVGMDDLPEGFPTPSLTLPMTAFNDVDQSQHFIQLWKNLSIYLKQPTYDGISPYAYLTTGKAIESGEYNKIINYPLVFFAEKIDAKQRVNIASIDTLSAQKMYIVSFDPNHISIDLNVPKSTHLVFVQNHHPSWEVFIDGKSSMVLRVSDTFMAVKIPKGKHVVDYRFEPRNVIRASFVSIGTLIAVFLYLIISTLLARRKKKMARTKVA